MSEAGTSAQDIIERYAIDHTKRFGEGGYGATFAALDRKTNEKCVVKVIDTRKMKVALIKKECQFLEYVRGHQNIIDIRDHTLGVGRHSHLYFIFMECASGGELFDQLTTHNGPVPEEVTKGFMVGLINAIAHCHAMGVAHRDIKLENVLLNSVGEVKLIDFGLSHQYYRDPNTGVVDRSRPLEGFCGSKSYAAPEVLVGRGYDGFDADMWSLGVCIFGLLMGFFPVDEAKASDWRYVRLVSAQKEAKSTTKAILEWYKRTPKHISPEAVDLLDQLLRIDASARPSIGTVLQHPWITGTKLEVASSGWSSEELHYRGSGVQKSFDLVDDMEIMDDAPIYRSLGAFPGDDEPLPEMPTLARQAAFGGQESAFGDIFAL